MQKDTDENMKNPGVDSFEGFAVGGGLFSDYATGGLKPLLTWAILAVFVVAMIVLLYEVFTNAGKYDSMVLYPCYALVAAVGVSIAVDATHGDNVGTAIQSAFSAM